MRRRGFLQCIALSYLAAVLPWREASGWQIAGEATAPGARLQVDLALGLPPETLLLLDLHHDRADGTRTTSRHAALPVTGGQRLELVTPYPYQDLVAGRYAVALTLQDAHGAVLERHAAGSYTLRRVRFSA